MKRAANIEGQKSRIIRIAVKRISDELKFTTEIFILDANITIRMMGVQRINEKLIDVDRYVEICIGSLRLQNFPMNRLIPIGIPSEKMLIIKLSSERIADAVPTVSGETYKEAMIQ